MLRFGDIFTLRFVLFDVVLLIYCSSCERLLNYSIGQWQRAFTDSSIHATIAGLVWLTSTDDKLTVKAWVYTAICAFIASAIDIDHFIAAGSLSLQSAVSLTNRPLFHNTTLLVTVNGVLALFSSRLAWLWPPSLFASAWISHHLRDSTRRGLWITPFGHTKPLPPWLYMTLIGLLPIIIRLSSLYHAVKQTDSSVLANADVSDVETV